ncbi:hypothetical protein DPMN_114638 [Dreissena polymorpha]|uniref:Uncharacterized protein n=1 Tax=Dreissena polymorpha TaxID=45954 RepID=A0A9D4KKE7_DREPO|nr:hypothetical protein DPMN_114638 [Dreissena polymorpha]
MRTRNADTWKRSNRFQPVRFFADTDTRTRNAETWKPGQMWVNLDAVRRVDRKQTKLKKTEDQEIGVFVHEVTS